MAASGTEGDDSPKGGARHGARLLAYAYLAVFALLFAAAACITLFGDPHAGDPEVRLALHLTQPKAIRTVPSGRPVNAPPALPANSPPVQQATALPPAQQTSAPPATAPVTPPIPVGNARALVADPALIENTPQGPLPRIADNGTTPMRAYAAPVVSAGKQPRIAIVISGFGISSKAMQGALGQLPAGVTLAFLPYEADVQTWVTAARQKGHEVLLEVPMEPYDFPDSDPGQYTLRSSASEDTNTQKLVWAMTRFTGYAGVTNFLGGRFLSDSDALEPVLTYLTRRGLMFFDNGSANHSVAPDVAQHVGLPFAQATRVIDSIQAPMEIDSQLSQLENDARAKGSASGAGFLYPVTIERVSKWAQGLAGRGFVLVPISAIVSQSKS
jgi:hypothetical protein